MAWGWLASLGMGRRLLLGMGIWLRMAMVGRRLLGARLESLVVRPFLVQPVARVFLVLRLGRLQQRLV